MTAVAGIGQFAAIGVGAMLGAWLRWGLAIWLNDRHASFFFGTWVANLLGGLLIGMLVAWFGRHPGIDPLWRLATITGFLGALTTFSTFSAEALALVQRGQWGWAGVHAGAHLFGCLAAAALGHRLVAG